MADRDLILVLGDQLSASNPALAGARPGRDVVLMAEVAEEAVYVAHNRHKIAFVFSAMRHFRDALRRHGHPVRYREFDEGVASLAAAVEAELAGGAYRRLVVCEPGEYRLRAAMQGWSERFGLDVDIVEDTRFLCSLSEFEGWAGSRRQLRMEDFYRWMRKRYRLLLEPDGEPCGGRWNYDRENRKGWRATKEVPERPAAKQDACTREVLELVARQFPDNPGDLSRFHWAVTAEDAEARFEWFCHHALGDFGTFQDALAEESPWLFHSLVSLYINVGLLDPLSVCRRVEAAWRGGECTLAAAEGFIRQILGWREYVRGVYWRWMPEYAGLNHFDAERPLPGWFWDAKIDLRCLASALESSLELGYAHHIQRLMVIGNFALLAGLDVGEVCRWYLAVYVDAFEWVELPNTLGMALHADGGRMATKPYAASGKYIQRQGNHCARCRFDPGRSVGEDACPYNALYWRFIDRHRELLEGNPRMSLVLANWRGRKPDDRRAILARAEAVLEDMLP